MKNSTSPNSDELQMKFSQSQFSNEVKKLIESTEEDFVHHCDVLLKEFKPVFAEKKQRIYIEVIKNGTDVFSTDYISFVLIKIEPYQKNKSIRIELPIWRCQRSIMGIPIEINIPGSRIKGTLIKLKNAQNMFREFIQDNLKKD